MNKIFLATLFVFFSTVGFSRQDASTVNLATLAKAWGFLKYYHPYAAYQGPDWDTVLLQMIPKAKMASTKDAFHEVLLNWYDGLPAAPSKAVSTNADLSLFNESSIQKMGIPTRLQADFINLLNNHVPDSSRYISDRHGEYILDYVKHIEHSYVESNLPGESLRLLALFRYWNTIEFFYPHTDFKRSWSSVLDRYLPVFLKADNVEKYRYAIMQLIHEIRDSHSFIQYEGQQLQYKYISPVRIDYIDEQYVITQIYSTQVGSTDLLRGDIIMSINGSPIKMIEGKLSRITTGTNELSFHRNIANQLLRGTDSVFVLELQRGNKKIKRQLTLSSSWKKGVNAPAKLWEEKNPGIWYVNFCSISNPDTLKYLFNDINKAAVVIWEMRAYPNYSVTLELQKWMFESNTLLSTDRSPLVGYPGKFSPVNNFSMLRNDSSISTFTGKMIVLVNEHTQSLAESVAASLRLRPNTIVAGRQTAGTTGNITWLPLPGDIAVSYTGVHVTGANSSFSQGKGVTIDIPIQLTARKIAEHPDYILHKAQQIAQEWQSTNQRPKTQ